MQVGDMCKVKLHPKKPFETRVHEIVMINDKGVYVRPHGSVYTSVRGPLDKGLICLYA